MYYCILTALSKVFLESVFTIHNFAFWPKFFTSYIFKKAIIVAIILSMNKTIQSKNVRPSSFSQEHLVTVPARVSAPEPISIQIWLPRRKLAVLWLDWRTGSLQNRNHMVSNLQDFFKSTKKYFFRKYFNPIYLLHCLPATYLCRVTDG